MHGPPPLRHILHMLGDPRDLDSPLETSIAHCLRLDVVSLLAPELPDTVSRQTPVIDDEIGERLHESIVHPSGDGKSVPRRKIERVQHIAVGVHLELLRRRVPDPHRRASPIPFKRRHSPLRSNRLSLDGVHEPKIEIQCGVSLDEPAEIPLRLASVSKQMKGPERMSRVSNPRIPIVPVHVPPKNLRQRSGGRSNNSPCRSIDKHLQRQRGAHHLPPPTSLITQLSNTSQNPVYFRGSRPCIARVRTRHEIRGYYSGTIYLELGHENVRVFQIGLRGTAFPNRGETPPAACSVA